MVELRPPVLEDEPAIAAIFEANDESLASPGVVGWPYLDFLIAHSRSLVAVTRDELVGFGAAVEAGPITHLCDLFVRPDHHGQGIGQALLVGLMPASGARTTFASADPRALPIYARSGMRPSWPLLYLQGRTEGLPSPDPSVSVHVVPMADAGQAHLELTGIARPALDTYQAGLSGATPFILQADGAIVGVGLGRAGRLTPGRVLDRLIVGPEPDPSASLLAAVVAAAAGGVVTVTVPGPHPLLKVLLDAGFRIVDSDTYCESEPGLLDPERRIPNTGFL